MKNLIDQIIDSSQENLGNSLLSIVLLIGIFLILLTLVRILEISIRIFLEKGKTKKEIIEIDKDKNDKRKGF